MISVPGYTVECEKISTMTICLGKSNDDTNDKIYNNWKKKTQISNKETKDQVNKMTR